MQIQPATAADSCRDDVDAITELVTDLERAQRNEQPAAFTGLFQTDTVWVTAHGKRLTGWDEINEFTHRVLPGAMRESTATYEVCHILFVRPDVAVVNVRQRPIFSDGSPVPDVPEGRPVYVLARNDGIWSACTTEAIHCSPDRCAS